MTAEPESRSPSVTDPVSVQLLDRDGTSLAYHEVGTGDPTFVFVHGWTCSHNDFAPQVDHFGRRHRAIAVDLRGHGASDAPQQRYTVPDFADDVAWLCAQLTVDRPVLVGHSMGGAIVLEVAARHPDLPRAIVMLDAAPIADPSTADRALVGLSAALGGPDAAAVRAELIEYTVANLGRDPQLQTRVRDAMAAVPDHVAHSCMVGMEEWDGPAAARACQVPTLHIAADEPINEAASLRALNPLLRTGQTVGAGHFHQIEVPDQVNAMIERFLAVSA